MQAIAWDIFRELARTGHEVTVITTRINGKPATFTEDGVTVIAVQSSKPERYSFTWWAGSRNEVKKIGLEKIDGVLSISIAAAGLIPLKSQGLAAPFLFQAHGTSWGELVSKWRTGKPVQILKSIKNLYWFFKDAMIYRKFDELILVGDMLEEQFKSFPTKLIAHDIQYTLIRNGVDTNIFRPNFVSKNITRQNFGISEDARVLVFAARLHPQKGCRESLLAFRMLAELDKSVHFLIIGGGEEQNTLQALVKLFPPDISSRTHFTGSVSRKDIPELLVAGDVFVFPTLRQEVGLTMNVLEALACGLPAICSESMRAVFDAKLPIRFIDPQNPKAISEAIAEELKNKRPMQSLLTPEYSLQGCVQAYVRRFEALRQA
ncbi:glycosyltransferase family 4 protein [Methylovorus sp. MM2]|uniref:glycosyltransferase family 4 protein n=1 Tax=Methylovorus sp. MM2 TaxID=1848038 RepID=UPI0013F4C91D|nr:glycosyltransferase family 4 protein [Methylovorus sp. MM2]